MKKSVLHKIEDAVHGQLKRLSAATEADAALKPLHDQLRDAWAALYAETRRRDELAARADGGDEELVTVFKPRADGKGVMETRICKRLVIRRYHLEPGAREFVDVIPACVTQEDLSQQMRSAAR